MSRSSALERLEQWKNVAFNQYLDPTIRNQNNQKIVISLFDLSGTWSQPWVDAGYQVFRFDIQADPYFGDINNFSVEFFNELFACFDGLDVHAILAACPCTDFAVSGARHFTAKDADGRTLSSIELVYQTLRTIEFFKPNIWAIENPVGRIASLTKFYPFMPKA
ncbi:DNA cytosine methyltransferase [Acinetobacter ursingii]|uniref:DNA cytosine methyltransferase n=1 Tax=Acinetobacter ursingii TaxID=108980 RepID=UPI00244D3457|nr:DNA cytosine methyltransferase [Acinetobacter ursingii]MDH2020217.1 DNA cytosine methyltransferase [Acinetobacter ursingii]MDH2073183.1 DNA cytosine methyltransferase [Acinetobacter ursingii]